MQTGMKPLTDAIQAHKAGNLELAEKIYRAHMEAGDNAIACQMLGLLYSQQGNDEEAARCMQASLAIDANQPEVHNNIANCYKRTGHHSAAIHHYGEAIRLKPDYADAYRNLSLLLLETGEVDQALTVAEEGLVRQPRHAPLLNLLGQIKVGKQDYAGAIECYEEALTVRPGHIVTEHNLAVARRLNNQPKIALRHYQTLLDRDVRNFQLYQNIGNAYSDLGELDTAIGFFRRVIELNPAYVDAHHNLSDLLWSTGRKEEFIASYEKVFSQGVISDELVLSCGETLLAAEQAEQALRHLEQRMPDGPPGPAYADLLARCHLAAGNPDQAIFFHELACRDNPSLPYLLDFGITLLQTGNVEHAENLLARVFREDPGNQFALSHLTLCWRLLGDEREQTINNYEQLVGAYELPTPPGFSSLKEFNTHLDAFLTRVHTSKHYPYEQTLRGGTQTQGNLLAWDDEELKLLVGSLGECIREHLEHVASIDPPFAEFPRTRKFDFSASWSVKLRSEGYHTMHVHPMGWFSSAYYVDLPDDMDKGNREGWLKFGEPNFEPRTPLPPQHYIQPAPGRLALFPSYMWHGTVPFRSEKLRTTVVFDIVPVMT